MTIHTRNLSGLDSLDPVSKRLLPILRHFLATLQGDSRDGWVVAYGSAVDIWGEGRGLAIAHRCTSFLSALLLSRPVPLDAIDPMCVARWQTVTEDEHAVLALLAAARDDNTAQARTLISDLTGGRVDARVVRSLVAFVALLGGPGDKHLRATKPRLRAV